MSERARVGYRIQTAARMSGLGETVLRAWERRYGLVKPARGASGYREYSAEDLRVLVRARELVDRGLSIGEVARMGRARLLAADGAEELLPASESARDAGTTSLVDALIRAVARGEVAAAEEIVARGIRRDSLRATLRDFVGPSLVAAGDAWERGELSPAGERLATQLLRAPLEALLASANLGLGEVRVLCAPAPGDTHEMGALMVALECARAGFRAIHLGGPLETEHVTGLAQLVRPRCVCLSFVHALPAKRLRELVREVRAGLPSRTRLAVGGRGLAGLETELQREGLENADDIRTLLASLGTA